MPVVDLVPENKVKVITDYPKLTLDHQERALIVLIEPRPVVEFTHTLRAPEIGPDGRIIKEEKTNSKGETYESPKTEFMGQHLCLGDYDTVAAKGVDPDNCPTCRAHVEQEGIPAAVQKYGMHVIRYSLKPNSWELRDPFNVDCVAWTFSGNRLNQLIEFASDWGDLTEHDLKLGPCENKMYQKYDINVTKGALWRENEERTKIVVQTYKNNKAEDLSSVIARRLDKNKMLEDVQRVVERLSEAYGRNSTSTTVTNGFTGSEAAQTEKPAPSGLDVFAKDTDDAGEPKNETKPATTNMSLQDIMAEL